MISSLSGGDRYSRSLNAIKNALDDLERKVSFLEFNKLPKDTRVLSNVSISTSVRINETLLAIGQQVAELHDEVLSTSN